MLEPVQHPRCARRHQRDGARGCDRTHSRARCGRGQSICLAAGGLEIERESILESKRVMPDFLLEIGLEEVPARMIAGAEAELGRRVGELLTRERLLEPAAKITTYSTPRRLAVLV